MIKRGLRPAFELGLDLPGDEYVFRRVLPFRRAWIAIIILTAMDIAFMIPAVSTFQQALSAWSQLDSLFDLTTALFLSAWLLGWLTAPLIMTFILALMLFGREVLKASPGVVEVFIGVSIFGATIRHEAAKMRNLRLEQPKKNSGKSWRGPHLAFDYGANTSAVGSAIDEADATQLITQLQTASGQDFRSGDALPAELDGEWKKEQASEPAPIEPVLNRAPLTLASPSVLILIIANMIPIAGSAFLNWNLADVMVLYWAESAVIGFFNLGKIIVINRWMALLSGPFFLGHFGGFMSIHFLFIYTIFVKPAGTEMATTNELADVAQMFIALWPALAALFISHAYSFYKNFLGRREYRGRTLKQQMTEPYSRIIFMQVIIIFGGGLTLLLGNPTPVLILVIGFKIYFDVKAHLKQRAGS